MKNLDFDFLAELSDQLQKKKLTVAVAESCTSGLIQYYFSQMPEAMSVFQGGMTVYNSGQKCRHLDINPVLAEACNAVDKTIAEKMALKIAEKFNAECGLAITGYAQPVPEEDVNSCYAYVAVTRNSKVIISKKVMGDAQKNLAENQKIFAEKILTELLIALQK